MYEHAIPQNIMDYEFKLFAGLTLKQFIYVAMAGGISFLLFIMNRNGQFPSLFAWIVIPTVLIVGITMGLGSLQGRTSEDWLTSFMRATQIPLRRVWKKDTKPVTFENFMTTKPEVYPTMMAIYFYSQDEFRKIMQQSFTSDASYAQQQTQVISAQTPVLMNPTISLTLDNAQDYAQPGVVLPAIPNTIAFSLQEDGIPIEGVAAYLKDANNTVISALRSNKDGIIYFNQSFANGQYSIDFQGQSETSFPKLNILFNGFTYPLINISPVE